MEQFFQIMGTISGFLWGPWTFFVLMGAGILFTFWTRFSQFKALTHGVAVIRGKYDNPDDPGAINHFQALSAALSATVGLGNIGGVALAVAAGGPGAVFWIWVIGFLGMAIKTVEVTLAMIYRNVDDPDNPHGGAMWVIDKTLGAKGGAFKALAKILGVTFCITLIVSAFTGGNMFQSWSVAQLSLTYFAVPKLVTGIALAAIVGLVIIGGIKRIGSVAGKLVPFMCLLYLIAAFAVLGRHIPEIPALLMTIVKSAFNPQEATGAFLGGSMGWAFSTGLRRALFSNEAGQGSAPIAHSAAKTDEPVREGVVSGLEPFIDTICICTLTALVILTTNTWNRDASGEFAADIQLTSQTNNGTITWTVETSGGVEALPAPEYGDAWSDQDKFNLVAMVSGATRKDTGFNRVQLLGKVVKGEDDGSFSIEWEPLVIKPSEWDGSADELNLVDKGVYQVFEGAPLTAFAFDQEYEGLGRYLVTLAAWLFAISTMISWGYYGEQGILYITGPIGVLPYKVLFLFGTVFAAVGINSTSNMEILMDLGTGAMLWANMPIVLMIGYVAVNEMNVYFKKLKAGEFNPYAEQPISDVGKDKDADE